MSEIKIEWPKDDIEKLIHACLLGKKDVTNFSVYDRGLASAQVQFLIDDWNVTLNADGTWTIS